MQPRTAYLARARVNKNDEFYTRLCDIEQECDNYLTQFRDKIIYCNCDTADSNFVKYFARGLVRDAGIPVLTNIKHKIEHNKFAVFDARTVVSGSYNWTASATKSNSENCLFFN